MHFYHRTCCLLFDIVDELTEDASMMMEQQENKAGCIRTMLLDFIRANGIVNNYDEIPEKERMEKFFGYTAYSGKATNTPQQGEKEPGGRKCRFQFDIYADDRLENDVLTMMSLQCCISMQIKPF